MSIERPTPNPTGPPLAQIGNYDVLQKLATGGMGEVFLARQRGPIAFSRYVVLKRLHPQFVSDSLFIDMFLNEAQIAANLSHANIAHIYELFEDGNNGYVIAMEYVRGGTVLALLRERARKQKLGLPYGTVARITNAVCEALHYAYFEPGPDGAPRHVIHRDISPSNVIIGYDGQIKLVDFGIAKALHAEATHATSLKGKYGYMSPEQIRSQPVDHRTDIFSLGTMMWEMFVGKRLFKRDSDMQMLYAILEEDIPKPSDRSPEIPPAVDHIVMRALSRTREERYQDALEIAQDMKAVATNNEWETESSTVGRLVRELIPMDMTAIATGGDKPGSDSGRARPSRQSISIRPVTSTVQELAPAPAAENEPEIEVTHERNKLRVASQNDIVVLVVLLLVLLSSVVFWLGIVPHL